MTPQELYSIVIEYIKKRAAEERGGVFTVEPVRVVMSIYNRRIPQMQRLVREILYRTGCVVAVKTGKRYKLLLSTACVRKL